MKRIIIALFACATLFSACDKKTTTTTPGTSNTGNNNNNNPTTVDPTTYEQYITCKIDGTTYTAYYTAGHTTNLNCVYNTKSQTTFETSADEVKENGETMLSNMSITLYSFQDNEAGTYTSGTDLYLDGTLERMVNGKKQRFSYIASKGETFTVASYKDGMIEGTFSMTVYDENNSSQTYQVTGGKFKMKVK